MKRKLPVVFLATLATIIFTFGLGHVFAETETTVPIDCALLEVRPERISNIKDKPSYFMKVTADGRYMCYIINAGNVILDLDRADTSVIVPGPYDPVPAPPVGSPKVVQHLTSPTNGGMSFYKMSDITAQMVEGKTTDLSTTLVAEYQDPKAGNDYQSLGVLPGKQAAPVYRMLSGSLMVDDYDTSSTPWERRQHFTACGAEGRYQLPMLSKNGQELATYDTTDGTTKIMSILPDGTCEEKLNLGFGTGKVEFNYDGSAIAFHVDTYSTTEKGMMFSGVAADMTKNIYVMQLDRSGKDLRRGPLRRLTSNSKRGQGSYYPSFTLDGKIVYAHGERDVTNNMVSYSFRTVDPQLAPATDLLADGNEDSCRHKTAAQLALGALWNTLCTPTADRLGAVEAALWTLSLDADACRRLVRKNWVTQRQGILDDELITRTGRTTKADLTALTVHALEAVCPEPATRGQHGTVKVVAHLAPKAPPAVAPPDAKGVFIRNCMACHMGTGGHRIDWDNLSVDEVKKMLGAIEGNRMPPFEVNDRKNILKPLADELRPRLTTP